MLRFICALLIFALSLTQYAHAADCSSLLKVDFLREWGVQLLDSKDPAFSDPTYIAEIVEAAKPTTVSFYNRGNDYWTAPTTHFEDFEKLLEKTSELHGIDIIRFTNSGTEANNALFELAELAFTARTGKTAKRANLLYFEKPYGGSFGRIAQMGIRFDEDEDFAKKFKIPTPHTIQFAPSDAAEIRRIEKLESEALQFIRKQVAKDRLEIGGIFIEPVSATPEIFVYRPEFMTKLRALADELHIPIFADEILTGGGRTGKFWAYQNYPDFEPDLVTFGKGLIVSGVAQVNRWTTRGEGLNERLDYRWKWPKWSRFYFGDIKQYPKVTMDNTSRVSPLVMIQAKQVLQRIQSDHLAEKAAEVGAYAIAQMKTKALSLGLDPEVVRGVGLLIYSGPPEFSKQLVPNHEVRSYLGRWTPQLTISREDFDRILQVPVDHD